MTTNWLLVTPWGRDAKPVVSPLTPVPPLSSRVNSRTTCTIERLSVAVGTVVGVSSASVIWQRWWRGSHSIGSVIFFRFILARFLCARLLQRNQFTVKQTAIHPKSVLRSYVNQHIKHNTQWFQSVGETSDRASRKSLTKANMVVTTDSTMIRLWFNHAMTNWGSTMENWHPAVVKWSANSF